MQPLPINEVLEEIIQDLQQKNRVVLQAPPGAGKTTAVPIALLEQNWLDGKQIILLEPRRLAARNAASRMAYLLGEKVGQTVGYQIRQDNCFTKQTRILVVTEGILTRKLQADPELSDTALVIFDEFHERSLHADLSLALCLQSQQILRDDLKILVMSATLNTDAVAQLLFNDERHRDESCNDESSSEDDNYSVIVSQGRSYPVELHYLDHTIKQADRNQLITALSRTCKQVISDHEGNCLVFLPGIRVIKQLQDLLESHLKESDHKNIIIAPLYGNLSKQQQDKAISTPPVGKRKIVLATNIAETSITIDGISCVIDSGLERVVEHSPATAMNRLKTQTISADSAEQRSGRAGRLSAGHCYRMWTEPQQKRLRQHSIAEILHSDLSSLVLELANWGVQDTRELHWLDLPPAGAFASAKQLLQQLAALDDEGKITSHGRTMLKLGTHPRLAHMLLSSIELGQAYHACMIASLLTEKDIFPAHIEKSIDIHERLKVLLHDNSGQHVDMQQCRQVTKTADELFKRLKSSTRKSLSDESLDHELSGVLLAFAYPDRIAKQRRPDDASYQLSNGTGAVIPVQLQHQLFPFLVIANLNISLNNTQKASQQANILLAAEITEDLLESYCHHLITQAEHVRWNADQQRVESKQVTSIGKIILRESTHIDEDDETHRQSIQHCLLQGIRDTGINCLNWTPQAVNLKQRIQFINHYNTTLGDSPFQEPALPDMSEQWLSENLATWLQPHLSNENSLKQCQKLDIYTILLSLLSWDQQQAVNRIAPEKITVPSGSDIRIDYTDPTQPVLSVRLQEVFGLNDTPLILDGRCKLMMHLLSPARRPMQVTQDLNSFWQTTYHDVKKELRGKYKKHYWPDDPLTATATSKTKKQMERESTNDTRTSDR